MACRQRKAGAGTIVHSDHGAPYTSQAWQDMLFERRMIGSMSAKGNCYDNAAMMSAKGNCYDNAAMERFFGTLKDERIKGETLKSPPETKQALGGDCAGIQRKVPAFSTGQYKPMRF